MVGGWDIKGIALLVIVCLCLGAAVFTGASHVVARQNQQTDITRAVCISQNTSNATLRNLLSFIEGRTLENAQISNKQRSAIVAFYAGAQKQLPTQQKC